MTPAPAPELGAVAIVAPGGRDASVVAGILGSAGVASATVSIADTLDGIATAGFAAALVAEEALGGVTAAAVSAAVSKQPPWSDFPFVVLTWRDRGRPSNPVLQALRNVTEVERPVHPATLLGTVRSALRARARQHETASHLAARHAAERELRGLAQTLEARVAERTSELQDANHRLQREIGERSEAEARVRSMQAQLIHMSRLSAMDTMGSTIAHELNQPLAAILNYMRGVERLLGRMDDVPGDLSLAVAAVAANAHRAGTVIRRLRDLVQHRPMERAPESLTGLLAEAQALGLIDLSGAGIAFALDVEPDANAVLVDRVQMQQVLINLVRNATEAIAGQAAPAVRVAARRAGADRVEVTVADNGPGFPPDFLAAGFPAFKTGKPGGLGIGLSICRTIIEDHGGSIDAANSPEGGAVIRLLLPAAADPG